MKRAFAIPFAMFMLFASVSLLSACKTPEEKVCGHLQGFVDDGSYSEGECQKDIGRIKEKCSNAEAIFECFLTKDKEEQLRECEKKCEKK
ncbi:MAG: hypothetical protein RBU37_01145 [Myxococcota bacterium]|jgi:hypothetical protein|nr:hypothetical protein [Myxococcota bacterium]